LREPLDIFSEDSSIRQSLLSQLSTWPIDENEIKMQLQMASLKREGIHHLLSTAISPLPIAFISTINPEGIFNAAPFSYICPICSIGRMGKDLYCKTDDIFELKPAPP
jgi:hypothetical protein